ncbi:hypothetical protein Taro_043577, partial [Colocasia esculenta]|nr:hypothetical protein [Colocasia esculenta]
PWLREVGVVEHRPVRTSRDVMSGQSNKPRHRKVLYFPHRRLWTTEYSCKFWPKAILASIPGRRGGVSVHPWTPTLILASNDVDAYFSDLHALQSQKFPKQESSAIGELSPTALRAVLSPCVVGDVAPLVETVETDSERGD